MTLIRGADVPLLVPGIRNVAKSLSSFGERFTQIFNHSQRGFNRQPLHFLMNSKNSGTSKLEKLSPVKRRAFTVIMISSPFVFIVLVELALRVFGYGVDVRLFKRQVIWGQVYYQMNPDVTYRYFATSPFKPSTDPVYFQMPKPRNVYRIFCLGESTSAGYPYWFNGAFPAYLLTRLKTIFPSKKIELINLSLTATSSYAALDIARELPSYQPDLVIYYGGHNEFYGALGIASNQSVSSFRFITELYLYLIHFRIFQLVQNMTHGMLTLVGGQKNSLQRGTEMEQVARGHLVPFASRLYEAAYRNFKNNLDAMRSIFGAKRIPFIVGTQVSNLRDQPPFVSGHSPDLSNSEKIEFSNYFSRGIRLQSLGKWDSAAAAFVSAVHIDSTYADAHYRLAQCLDTTGQKLQALKEYTIARNYDELRFRTDSNFNNLIRSIANNKYCFVADVVKALKAASPDSLVGYNYIWEHLHPNSRGAFLIAKCYADVMMKHGILASRKQWASSDTVSDSELWSKRYVTKIDERMAEYSVKWLKSGWPFKNQNPHLSPVSPRDTLNWIAEQAVAGKVSWVQAHTLAIYYFLKRNNIAEVADIYRSLLAESPLDISLHSELADAYIREGLFKNAEEAMLNSVHIHPTYNSFMKLGDIMMRMSSPDSALGFYEKGYDFAQSTEERLRGGMAISYAYARAGHLLAAKSTIVKVLQEFPNFQPAQRLLQDIEAIMLQSSNEKMDHSKGP